MSYNDLSACNCCPTISPCSCADPLAAGAVPCCFTISNHTHCGFQPTGLCRAPGNCEWYSDATYALVEASSGKFPTSRRIYWRLERYSNADGRGDYLLYLTSEDGTTNDDIAVWAPSDPDWDPLFDSAAHDFEFDSLVNAEGSVGVTSWPSVVNCDWPGGCGSELTPDGSLLPQTVSITPSCLNSGDACASSCAASTPIGEVGCEECSDEIICPDGTLNANCTWEWNGTIWEVTSNDCSNSTRAGCSCVPMMDGCDTQAPGIFEPSLVVGPCYSSGDLTEGVQACS